MTIPASGVLQPKKPGSAGCPDLVAGPGPSKSLTRPHLPSWVESWNFSAASLDLHPASIPSSRLTGMQTNLHSLSTWSYFPHMVAPPCVCPCFGRACWRSHLTSHIGASPSARNSAAPGMTTSEPARETTHARSLARARASKTGSDVAGTGEGGYGGRALRKM